MCTTKSSACEKTVEPGLHVVGCAAVQPSSAPMLQAAHRHAELNAPQSDCCPVPTPWRGLRAGRGRPAPHRRSVRQRAARPRPPAPLGRLSHGQSLSRGGGSGRWQGGGRGRRVGNSRDEVQARGAVGLKLKALCERGISHKVGCHKALRVEGDWGRHHAVPACRGVGGGGWVRYSCKL